MKIGGKACNGEGVFVMVRLLIASAFVAMLIMITKVLFVMAILAITKGSLF